MSDLPPDQCWTLPIRIIPRLDIKGPNLVKGIHLEGLRVLGKPELFAKRYYEEGADELFFQDVVASLYGRNSLHDVISKTAKNIFIPLTVGGGLRTTKDISMVLRFGADKVAINTAAHETPEVISSAANMFGKSTIAVAVEAIRQPNGKYEAFTDNGRNRTGREVVEWVKYVERLGAGEIVLTSVDREGSGEGLDLDLIGKIHRSITIPLVVHGGVGKPNHILELLDGIKVSGVAMASMLHYSVLERKCDVWGADLDVSVKGQKNSRTYSRVTPKKIGELKEFLRAEGIACRML